MKILFVTNYFHKKDKMHHGHYPLIYNIVKKISEVEDVTVLTAGWPRYPPEEYIEDIKVLRVLAPGIHSLLRLEYFFLGFSGMAKELKEKPDVINSQGVDGVLLFKMLNSFGNSIPKIFSLKGLWGMWSEKIPAPEKTILEQLLSKADLAIPKLYEKMGLSNSNSIVVPSEYVKESIKKLYSVDERRVDLIPNGVDTDIFRPMEVERGNEPTLFFPGGDSLRKGSDIVVKSFVRLKKDHKDLKLVIAGSSNIKRLEPLLKKHKDVIGGDLAFKGIIPYTDMPRQFNSCDIFVLPSYHETFGSTLVEAMACGKPVVATNDTAIPEVVGDCGRLIQPGNVEELSNNISELLDDENERKELGKKARKRVEEKFKVERVINDYLDLFRRIAK